MRKIEIKGIKWSYYRLPHDKYKQLHGDNSLAHVLKHKREIVFDAKYLDLPTVLHEVTHAFFSSCCIDSTNDLSNDDVEEIFCEIVSYHIDDIKKTANKIYNVLKPRKK